MVRVEDIPNNLNIQITTCKNLKGIKLNSKIEIHSKNLREIKRPDEERLDAILQKSENASIFHTLEWNKIIEETFNKSVDLLIAEIDDESIGFFPFYSVRNKTIVKKFISPIYAYETLYGGPIAVKGYEKTLPELLKRFERGTGGMVYVIQTPINFNPNLIPKSYRTETWYTSILDLTPPEEVLLKNMRKNTRNGIRRSERKGVEIIFGNVTHLDIYYNMWENITNRAGKEALPKQFYTNVVEKLSEKNMVKFLLAKYQDKIIAGGIFLCFKDTIYYWHGASYQEYLQYAPNNLLHWELIKWAKKNGYRFYDFVRIEPDKLSGIARFKMGWGGKTVNFYYARKERMIYEYGRKMKKMLLGNTVR